MARAIWKGAISFGLVHVPVALYSASQDSGIDFDWLDKRSMDPVGYKRINKHTGKEIEKENIVKGIKQDDGEYVILSDDEIKSAFPKSTQTIEIEAFVKASEISFFLLEQPYFLEPTGRGEKVYALLRESMIESNVIGISRVILHTKEHLAALIPFNSALMLNTIRWESEIKTMTDLNLPPKGKKDLKANELKMASQLIKEMTLSWNPSNYKDNFSDIILELVNRKIELGETEKVEPLEAFSSEEETSNVVDLTELLIKSLKKNKAA